MADDGDEVAVAARLDAQNAEAVLGVVEGYALDKASQHFLGRDAFCWGSFVQLLRRQIHGMSKDPDQMFSLA